jgi:hypothetical protein
LYQLEYHMKTILMSRLVRPSAAIAAAAVLASWFTFGGSQVVRAEDPEILSPSGQDMVLVPAKTVDALEQRVIFLEETVAALTESWQHVNTHRLCVSDDSGAETCIGKSQLDALLTQFARAQINQASVSQEANASPPAEPVEMAATTQTLPSSEPTTVVGKNLLPDQDPESTGTVQPAATDSTGAAVLSYPKVEIDEEPAAKSDE